jgi:hypothetical protein
MSRSVNSTPRPSAPQLLRHALRRTLAASFPPARRILSWNDLPIVTPGFQVRVAGTHVVVSYIQPRDSAPTARRIQARTMLEQYRQTLVAAGWQVNLVDERSKIPYLRCTNPIIMSTEVSHVR